MRKPRFLVLGPTVSECRKSLLWDQSLHRHPTFRIQVLRNQKQRCTLWQRAERRYPRLPLRRATPTALFTFTTLFGVLVPLHLCLFHLQPTAHASSLGPASHTVPGSLHRSSGSLPWKEEVHYLSQAGEEQSNGCTGSLAPSEKRTWFGPAAAGDRLTSASHTATPGRGASPGSQRNFCGSHEEDTLEEGPLGVPELPVSLPPSTCGPRSRYHSSCHGCFLSIHSILGLHSEDGNIRNDDNLSEDKQRESPSHITTPNNLQDHHSHIHIPDDLRDRHLCHSHIHTPNNLPDHHLRYSHIHTPNHLADHHLHHSPITTPNNLADRHLRHSHIHTPNHLSDHHLHHSPITTPNNLADRHSHIHIPDDLRDCHLCHSHIHTPNNLPDHHLRYSHIHTPNHLSDHHLHHSPITTPNNLADRHSHIHIPDDLRDCHLHHSHVHTPDDLPDRHLRHSHIHIPNHLQDRHFCHSHIDIHTPNRLPDCHSHSHIPNYL
ncbi:uncharacterized protein [Macaca fascicularis]|uniref:uncharacterized protein n=1 Tax=Macaca fascicularis TaxID=9541 RepID=UPI003D15933B